MNNENAPIRVGRFWYMQDGSKVPYIAGGSSDDGETDAGTGTRDDTQGADSGADNKDLLMKELKSVRAEAARYRRQLRELEAKFDNVDIEKYNELVKQQEELEKKKLEEKGRYEELLQEHQRRYEAQINKAQSTIEEWKSRYETQVIDNVLISASSDRAINPQEVVTLIRSQYKFQVNDQGEPEILDKNGQVVLDDNGAPMSPASIMEKFLDERPYLCKPKGGGAGSRGSDGPARVPAKDENVRGVERIKLGIAQRMGGGVR